MKTGMPYPFIVVALLLCGGCLGQGTVMQETSSPPQESSIPPPPHNEESVRFANEKGEKLAGRFFPAEGDTAVLLAHMGIADKESWHDFALASQEKGIAAFTFDFHCFGSSECKSTLGNPANLRDIRAAYGILREKGYSRIVCMGASMGGTACLALAMKESLAGLVVIASERPWGLGDYPKDLVDKAMPKLFIVTDHDPYESVISEIHAMHDASPEPRQLKVFPGNVHGTDIFKTEYGEEFRALLFGFLEKIRENPAIHISGPSPPLFGELAVAHFKKGNETRFAECGTRIDAIVPDRTNCVHYFCASLRERAIREEVLL